MNSSFTYWKKEPADWIMELEKIQTQLDGMGHVISDKDFMTCILAIQEQGQVTRNDFNNEDDPLTLYHILVELDTK